MARLAHLVDTLRYQKSDNLLQEFLFQIETIIFRGPKFKIRLTPETQKNLKTEFKFFWDEEVYCSSGTLYPTLTFFSLNSTHVPELSSNQKFISEPSYPNNYVFSNNKYLININLKFFLMENLQRCSFNPS